MFTRLIAPARDEVRRAGPAQQRLQGTIRCTARFSARSSPSACWRAVRPPIPRPGPRSATGNANQGFARSAGRRWRRQDLLRLRSVGHPRRRAAPRWIIRPTWLNQNKTVNVQIAGDCDERGTEEYNIALGSRRAYAAESYLAAKGVAANRMSHDQLWQGPSDLPRLDRGSLGAEPQRHHLGPLSQACRSQWAGCPGDDSHEIRCETTNSVRGGVTECGGHGSGVCAFGSALLSDAGRAIGPGMLRWKAARESRSRIRLYQLKQDLAACCARRRGERKYRWRQRVVSGDTVGATAQRVCRQWRSRCGNCAAVSMIRRTW
jgi:hypothetical protein